MIAIENLNFGYGKDTLFEKVDLHLSEGNIYGLLGLNGAGKSTLLQLMSGLLFAHEGDLNILNANPAERTPNFLSKLFVLSESVVVPNVTDSEYVKVRAPFYPNFDQQHLERCLTEFEVPRRRKLSALSHGQQKKFLLSFGLACRADLLILDEPTNGLDIPSKGLFRRLVAESLSDHQIIIVSTHQVHDLESLIDSIIILFDGQVLFNQSLSRVAEQLRMSVSNARPETDASLIYTEQTLGGFASLWQDDSAPDGQVDLELLFKAVIANPQIFPNLFSSEQES